MEAEAGDELGTLGTAVQERKAELIVQVVTGTPTEVRGTATTSTMDFASMTKDELYKLAQDREIEGRSTMKKDELIKALSRS